MLCQRFALPCQRHDVLASTGRAFGLPFMRNSDIRYADTVPSAVGGITRCACEYAKERGIDVEALLQKSGLTPGQIEQPQCSPQRAKPDQVSRVGRACISG